MRRVYANLDKDVESFDRRLIDWYYDEQSQIAKQSSDPKAHTKATVTIMNEHITTECDRRVIVDTTSAIRNVPHDNS